MNAWWTAEELDYGLEDSGTKVLVADLERVARTRERSARLEIATIGVRLGDEVTPDGVDRWVDVVEPGAAFERPELGPDDDATILYTSGTTGRPKGAVSTHRAVVQALMGFSCKGAIDGLRRPEEATGRTGAPVFILIVPLFHVTGNVPVMLGSLASGLKLVIMHKWSPERALQLIEREKVTNFVGVPTQSWDLLESPDFDKYDTSTLATVGGGGAPAPPQLVSRVANSFKAARPNIGYGMTETNAYGPGNSGTDYTTHPTSTGRSTPILKLEIRDPELRPGARRRARRDLDEGPQPHPRLLEQARRHRRDDRRRLAAHRRPRAHRRGRLRLHRGPGQGHDPARRRERLQRRGRGRHLQPPVGVRGRRVRPAPRAPGRRGGGGHRDPAGRDHQPGGPGGRS